MNCLEICTAILVFVTFYGEVKGHGRLWIPPSRASMWRQHYDNPKNYNDNALFCGGRAVSLFLISFENIQSSHALHLLSRPLYSWAHYILKRKLDQGYVLSSPCVKWLESTYMYMYISVAACKKR